MAIGKATLEAKVKELQERIEALEGGCHQDLPSTQFFNSSKEKNNEPAPFLSLEKQKTFKEKEEERIANKPVTKVIEEHFGGLSADGLEYVWFGDDFPIWARVMLALVFFGGSATMLFLIWTTIVEYNTFPYATSIQNKERSNAKWPSVTICSNHADVSIKKMEKIVEEDRLEKYSLEANRTFMKSFVRMCDFYHSNCNGEEEGTNIEDFWFLEFLGEKYGYCLEFNYRGKVNDMFCADGDECIFGLYGSLYGLNVFMDPSLTLNPLNEEEPFEAAALYDVDSHDTRYDGVYVALHGAKHEAMPTFNSVLSATGAATFISMNERETKRLSTPYHSKACSKDEDYSKSVCLTTCEEDIDVKCQLDHTKTLAENLHGENATYATCFHEEMESELCQCIEECNSDEWIPQVSSTVVHSSVSDEYANLTNIHLYYNAINLEIIEEVPVYNFYVLVGVVFGHIGFFTGFNLITIVQLFFMIVHVGATLLKKVKRRN
jgi:hypothetical protein